MNHNLRRRLRLIGLVGGVVALAFGLGYRLPWFDRHPDWQEFPHLTNPHLVVEEIQEYDHRLSFPTPRTGVKDMNFSDTYCTNLRAVRSLDRQITQNDFESGIRMPFSYWPSPAEMGHSAADAPPQELGFVPGGYEYLSVQFGPEVGYFKGRFSGASTTLARFYQYNQPRTIRDTLYLRYWRNDWRIFYR
jgi:hypothetical protein